MATPLVTVICLCYNHEKFVREAIESVINQSYPKIQIIMVDDFSTDSSRREIESLIKDHPQIEYLPLPENRGNCRAFNKGLSRAKGEFIVDFSTDDIFLKERIEKQVKMFSNLDNHYGVVFTDATYIDENSRRLYQHFSNLLRKGLVKNIPQGDVYKELLSTYFVASPTMLVRREVFEELNGYDETLAYEDFDFWIRSSRRFKYAYLDEVLTLIRKTTKSLSTSLYKAGDRQLHSTYKVCVKAKELNRTLEEDDALIKRIRYEFRHAVLSENPQEAALFYELLSEMEAPQLSYKLLSVLGKSRMPLLWLRRLYHWYRYD